MRIFLKVCVAVFEKKANFSKVVAVHMTIKQDAHRHRSEINSNNQFFQYIFFFSHLTSGTRARSGPNSIQHRTKREETHLEKS